MRNKYKGLFLAFVSAAALQLLPVSNFVFQPGMTAMAEDEAEAVLEEDMTLGAGQTSDEETETKEESSQKVNALEVDGLIEVVSEVSDSKGKAASEKKKSSDEKLLIVGYGQKGQLASIHFEMGEKPSLEQLLQQFPSRLDVYFLGEKESTSVEVTWESYSDDYNSTNLNYYFFTPKFDESKYAVKGMDLQVDSPYIEVIQNALTYDMIDSAPPKENEAAVYQYCIDKLGLNTAAACGILANIYCESGFRTNAIGDGGTSVGICQWHNGRWTNLKYYVPEEWETLEGQLKFMKYELMNGYRDTYSYILDVPNTAQGAYDAAYYWCMHFEMPDKTVSRSMTRGYLARNVYWERYYEDPDEDESDEDDAKDGSDEDGNEDELDVDGIEDGSDKDDAEDGPDESEDDAKIDSKRLYRCIAKDGLRIRSEESTDALVLGAIPFDAEVKVDEIRGEWASVSYEGVEGYCSMEFLEKETKSKEKEKAGLDEDLVSETP